MHATEAGLPRPTMAVGSGHGAHLFWRLAERTEPGKLSALVGDLADLLGSDPSVKNPSRILRLPGFMNHKKPAAACELLFADPDRRYHFDELRRLVPRPEEKRDIPSDPSPNRLDGTPQSPERVQLIERARRYVEKIEGSGKGGRTGRAFKVAAVLVNDYGLADGDALAILTDWDRAANSPPIEGDSSYKPGELSRILANARRYAKKPPGDKAEPSRPGPARAPVASIPLPSDQKPGGGLALAAEFEAEARGERQTIPLPWSRLSSITNAFRPGTVTVIGGPAGHGKSMFALQAAVHVHRAGVPWVFLPLEDRKVELSRRLLAHLSGDWSVINTESETAKERTRILREHQDELAELNPHVWENPRLPIKAPDGKYTVPALPFEKVLNWLGQALESARVIFIDPWTQIDFGDRDSWRGEKDFMRRLVGMVAQAGASVVLVAHTVKRGGKIKALPLSGEDLQGAAELKRVSHTIILLDAHDRQDSDVWRSGGCRQQVSHNRTLIVDKARNGDGAGARIAFNMEGPAFEELGIIAPKGAKAEPKSPPDANTRGKNLASRAKASGLDPVDVAERAAILEDGGMKREEAETFALDEIEKTYRISGAKC